MNHTDVGHEGLFSHKNKLCSCFNKIEPMNLLEKTEQLFHSARVFLIEAAAALYQVQQTEAWKEVHPTWGDYVNTLGLSPTKASKLTSTFEHFVIKGGVSHAKVASMELDRLYLSKGLQGTPAEQVEKALLLTRGELREQKFFEEHGQEHEHDPITVCRICDKRLS